MPLHNRGNTIERALDSLCRQTFREFEAVVVDCGSTDDTRRCVSSFFSSPEFARSPFPYRFETREWVPVGVEDWNEPVRLAGGAYIAMLEGDDFFLKDHLAQAHGVLALEKNIGIYATGNQRRRRAISGLIRAEDHLRNIYLMEEVPPPSETIFARLDKSGVPFIYNDKDYHYAPEIDLYMRIGLQGFDAYYASTQDVVRRISPAKPNTDWKYFADHFRVAELYKDATGIGPLDYRRARRCARKRAYYQYAKECRIGQSEGCNELRRRLVEKDSMMFYIYFLQARLQRVITKIKMGLKRLYDE